MPKMDVQKTEKLIETVRDNQALYDPAQKDYADFGVKVKLWSVVAGKCEMKNGHEAKMMWKNLRDCYRIYRNKLNGNPSTRRWKYYQQMDFLAPYIKDRKSRGLAQPPPVAAVLDGVDAESGESPDIDGISDIQIKETKGKFTTIQYWNEADEPKYATTEIGAEVAQEQDQIMNISPEAETNPESPTYSENESFEDILPEALNNGTTDNSLKMFFDAMYASTSQLPSNLQRSVKNKIFAAVLEGEEEAEKMRASPSRITRVKVET